MEYIAALDYKQIVEQIGSVYTGKEQIKQGVVYCSTEHIKRFFETHGDNGQKYVVVSACCDYGLFLQEEHPVRNDFIKGLSLLQLDNYDGYTGVVIPPRCNLDLCKKTDKYSLKCYAFTHSTFPTIPSNIEKWYLVNNDVEDDKIVNIPLGLYFENSKEILQSIRQLPKKDKLLYINYTNYTQERLILKNYFSQFIWADVDNGRRDFDKFIINMAQYKFVLCPEGNGLDCHRICESLYIGCIPILLDTRFARRTFSGTGALFINNWQEITEEFLYYQWEIYRNTSYDLSKIQLNYWKEQFENEAKLLC